MQIRFGKELLMCTIRLEPVEGPSREACGRKRRIDVEGPNIRELSQQLNQAQLAITELYQEKWEMRKQLAANTLEASTSHGQERNMTWLMRQFREV
jgi:hypothetical protein